MAAGGESGRSEEFAQTKIQLTETTGGDRVLLGDAKNLFAKGRREFVGCVSEDLGIEIRWRA